MKKQVSASDAKNSFGGLLDELAAVGRVDILKHGRLVAVMLSPRALDALMARPASPAQDAAWGRNHMIPPEKARAARVLSGPSSFDDE